MPGFTKFFLRGLLLGLIFMMSFQGWAQQTDDKTDSLYAARLMQANLELYSQIDSINQVVVRFKNLNLCLLYTSRCV